MTEHDNVRIDFSERTDYRIGAVTYQVAAFFDDTANNLKSKIQRLLKEDAGKENRTIAVDKDDAYN